MDKNKSLVLASVIFALIALLHLIRAVLRWDASVLKFEIPVYFSYLAAIILGYLAWHMYSASKA